MKIYLARYETRNFSFEALGKTEAEALKAMREGLETHAKQYGLAADWWRKYENDLSVHDMTVGACYRDNEPLKA